LAFGEMGSGYLTISALQTWDIADSTVATFAMVALIGETTGSFLTGWLADRFGHGLSLEIATLAAALAFLAALLAPSPSWFLVVFFLHGFFFGGRTVSGLMVVLEFAKPEKRPTYVGITSTFAGVGSMAAPLIGAGLALLGFNYIFIGSLIACTLAFLLLRFWVKEPRFEKEEGQEKREERR
ncbi:MAG: MFS transporter, partial [Chloroflexota bacterium]